MEASDVEFLRMPAKKDGSDSFVNLLPPASMVMASHLRDSPVWQRLFSEFVAVAASEKLTGPQLWALCDELTTKQSAIFNDKAEVYEKVFNLLPGARQRLRPGATAFCEESFLNALKADISAVTQATGNYDGEPISSRISVLSSLRKFLNESAFAAIDFKDLLQTVNEKLEVWRAEDSMVGLEEVLQGSMKSASDAARFVSALRNAKGIEVTPAIAQAMVDIRGLIHKAIADTLSLANDNDITPNMLEPFTQALDLINGTKAVLDMQGIQDRPVQLAFSELATKVMDLRRSFLALTRAAESKVPPGKIISELDRCVKAFAAHSTCHKHWSTPDNVQAFPAPDLRWLQQILSDSAQVAARFAKCIAQHCPVAFTASQKFLEKNVQAAKEVAGGHPSKPGQPWFCDVENLQDFEQILIASSNTLLVAKGEYIDGCKKRLTEAPLAHKVTCSPCSHCSQVNS